MSLLLSGDRMVSGKTTFAKEYLDTNEGEYIYLSADEIASEINPDDPVSVRLQAGREFYNRFDDLIEKEKNLLIESTLSEKIDDKSDKTNAIGIQLSGDVNFYFFG